MSAANACVSAIQRREIHAAMPFPLPSAPPLRKEGRQDVRVPPTAVPCPSKGGLGWPWGPPTRPALTLRDARRITPPLIERVHDTLTRYLPMSASSLCAPASEVTNAAPPSPTTAFAR